MEPSSVEGSTPAKPPKLVIQSVEGSSVSGKNRGQIAPLFVVMLSSVALILTANRSLPWKMSRHLQFQVVAIRQQEAKSHHHNRCSLFINRTAMLSYTVHELQPKESAIVQRLNETLDVFRFPIRAESEELRLPDSYFASKKAVRLRTRSAKFKHLSQIYTRLFVERKPVHVSILGGSNTAGSGLGKSMKEVRNAYTNTSYAARLERWLNKFFPPKEGTHTVHNFGRGGVGSCYFLLLVEKLTDPAYLGGETDLFILETSVNDILRGDMACFDQLITRISNQNPFASIISVHLTTGPDFLQACEMKQRSTSSCVGVNRQPIPADPTNRSSYPPAERWCDKRQIVDKHRVLQIDMAILHYMFCNSIPPFQHSRFISEMSFAKRKRKKLAPCSGKTMLLDYIARTDAARVKSEALLLTEGTYNNSDAYDSAVVSEYKRRFKEIERAISDKVGSLDVHAGMLGDFSLFSSDRIHIGRWGHLILTAEIATWLTWLSLIGYDGIENDNSLTNTVVEKTVWAAVTFDMGYYTTRSQSSVTNKHKAAGPGAKLDIHPLRPSKDCFGWKLMDDSGMHKNGLITLSDTPQSISFQLPKFSAEPHETFTVRLGYLKSYVAQMANFSVVLNETRSNTQQTTYLTGRHKQKVSVFVDSVVGLVNGTNEVKITVTSLPYAQANKVKIVAVYVTKSGSVAKA